MPVVVRWVHAHAFTGGTCARQGPGRELAYGSGSPDPIGQGPHPEGARRDGRINQAQIHRYEKGAAEPSMSALKRLALALGVTTDELVFEDDERGPDDELRLQFEAISRFSPDWPMGSGCV